MKRRNFDIAAEITSWGFYSYLVLFSADGMPACRRLFLFKNHFKRAEAYRDNWL
jgi:hypothetical protein